jgi:hypothetical protein
MQFSSAIILYQIINKNANRGLGRLGEQKPRHGGVLY